MSGAWTIAITRGQSERLAADEIERQRIACFLPKIKKTSRRNGIVTRHLRPLFPNYLFAFIDDNWRALLTTRGIVGVIMSGDKPATVSGAVIDDIKARCDTRGIFVPAPYQAFRSGQRVRATQGHFQNMLGIYEGMSGADRVRILFDLMGRSVSVTVEQGSLQAA